jgi:hypothetical protein
MLKTIQINPELFKSSAQQTRKAPRERIRVRGAPQTLKPSTVSRNLVKQIREMQNDLYKNMSVRPTRGGKLTLDDKFQSDFDKSKSYLESLSTTTPFDRTHAGSASLKRPIRDLDEMSETSEFNCPITHQNTLYNELGQPATTLNIHPTDGQTYHYTMNQMQGHGNLRGGVLPTYKTWKAGQQHPITPTEKPPTVESQPKLNPVHQKMSEILQLKSKKEVEKQLFKVSDLPQKKQKRTLKRTYHVGKSKHYSKVGILVSNKTLRNQATEKENKAKQAPIAEVRKQLVKRGLIKVGSNAPHDVLRKMYESLSLIVGDVMNHNTENLLHNYLNDATA